MFYFYSRRLIFIILIGEACVRSMQQQLGILGAISVVAGRGRKTCVKLAGHRTFQTHTDFQAAVQHNKDESCVTFPQCVLLLYLWCIQFDNDSYMIKQQFIYYSLLMTIHMYVNPFSMALSILLAVISAPRGLLIWCSMGISLMLHMETGSFGKPSYDQLPEMKSIIH